MFVVSLVSPILTKAGDVAPDEVKLKAHVVTLASPEYQGRRGAGGRKAADYLVEQFQALKLGPLFEGSYDQAFPGKEPGRNVGAVLRGSDAKLRDEWVVVSAHYDHLGTRGGVVYPGADDNASGVAMMLELARTFATRSPAPRRSLMFVGFDLEEAGLYGSRYFVEHSPVPLDRIKLFLTADMIGRSLGGVCEPYVFVMGTEHIPTARAWLTDASNDPSLSVGLLGSDILLLDRSDYGPFRARKVPYLFFSTGENPLYHSPADSADTVNYPKLAAISRLIDKVVLRAASADSVPEWSSVPDHPLEEALTIRAVIKTLLAHADDLKIGGAQRFLMTNALRTLDGIEARGRVTPEERTSLIRVARVILISVF